MINKYDENILLEDIYLEPIGDGAHAPKVQSSWSAQACAKRLGITAGVAAAIGLGIWYFTGKTTQPVQAPVIASSQEECTEGKHIAQRHIHYYNGAPVFGENDSIHVSEKAIDVYAAPWGGWLEARFSERTPLHDVQDALKGTGYWVGFSKNDLSIIRAEGGTYFSYNAKAPCHVPNGPGLTKYVPKEIVTTSLGEFYDYNGDGTIDGYSSNIGGLSKETANEIAKSVKERLLVDRIKAAYDQLRFAKFTKL